MPTDSPDWVGQNHPAKPVPDSTQAMFWWAERISLSAGTSNLGTMYTVAAGKKLILMAFNMSSSKSTINLLELVAGAAEFATSWFDTAHNCVFGGEGTVTLSAGIAVKRKIYNYGASTALFDITLFGILVDA